MYLVLQCLSSRRLSFADLLDKHGVLRRRRSYSYREVKQQELSDMEVQTGASAKEGRFVEYCHSLTADPSDLVSSGVARNLCQRVRKVVVFLRIN